jgi:HSP90 family molecular chaperone
VVQMVGKVNAQVRNRETGKLSIIHVDRIRELKENLEEEEEETKGMQQQQQRDTISSHAEENAGKQQKELRVSRGPAGAAAAVLAHDRDLRYQVEAEQGVKQKAKPKAKPNKTRKQIQMQAGWLPCVENAGKHGAKDVFDGG